jgi:2-polyprenyl-3-methyl-5-hydroxy-6-metoxy-1,4-benzoquinol methylase
MRLRSALRRIKRIVSRGPRWERYSLDEWDRQYATSTWDYLTGLEQAPRYAVIEGWRRRLKPTGSVLDLGCGEGVLFDQIPPAARVTYTGVDLSEVAIESAVRKVRDAALERFICSDLLTFEPPPGSRFDVIVFNEVLYYLADPLSTVRRYRSVLAPDGIIVVSVFHLNQGTWKAIDASLANERLQATVVQDVSSGKRWYLGLYHPRSK